MLRLYILRHAKSSWAVPGARDFDRELNERGLEDLVKLSSFMKNEDISPEKILCSSAVRTRQTLDALRDVFKPETSITYSEQLYSSGLSDYIDIINSVEDVTSLMIIGHNPMCGALATSLPGSGEAAELEKIAYKYPTAALSVIDFDLEAWSSVTKASGILRKTVFPSQL